jgi:hypothetical protein
MVPRREQQADILVQAVQNHNPDVIIVDEIGTKQVRGLGASAHLASHSLCLVQTARTSCHRSNCIVLVAAQQRRTHHYAISWSPSVLTTCVSYPQLS